MKLTAKDLFELKVVDEIDVYMIRASFVDIKNINVVAERPRKS